MYRLHMGMVVRHEVDLDGKGGKLLNVNPTRGIMHSEWRTGNVFLRVTGR